MPPAHVVHDASPATLALADDPFQRIVVGVDGTPEAVEAARQAAALRADTGSVHLVGVAEVAKAVHAGFAAQAAADHMRQDVQRALEQAAAVSDPATTSRLEGRPVEVLVECARRRRATLLALGASDHRRSAGLFVRAPDSVLVRDAPCSVFLARPDAWPAGHPERIVVGTDGSSQSGQAVAVARHLAGRFGARLTVLVGLGGKLRDASGVVAEDPDATMDPRPPVEALVAASRSCDLVVVGSRGLHGLHALGSVSERVAHRAFSSVLVVRQASSGEPSR